MERERRLKSFAGRTPTHVQDWGHADSPVLLRNMVRRRPSDHAKEVVGEIINLDDYTAGRCVPPVTDEILAGASRRVWKRFQAAYT